MTPSLLLTRVLAPTSDADCTKRNVPLSVITTTHAGTRSGPSSTSTTPTTDGASECDAYDAPFDSMARTNCTLVARLWTGTPMRAIVPLPARRHHAPALGSNGTQGSDPAQTRGVSLDADRTVLNLLRPRLMRSALFWDDADMVSGAESEGESGDDDATGAARCCSYESITAAQGLSAWSFEELRVECYAQSLVARGAKPPPVVQPALAIPPAFVPRVVP